MPLFPYRNFCAHVYRGLIVWSAEVWGGEMSGEAWSCFAHLPVGLIDTRSAPLTLNWLRPRPTYSGFKLSPDDVDEGRYERNLRLRRKALFAGTFVVVGMASAMIVDRLFELSLLERGMAAFAVVWVGTSGFLFALFVFGIATFAVMSYRRAEPRRMAFEAACIEFEEVDAWRRVRCDPKFWSQRLDDAGFEFEAAELLAGLFKTGQVVLTRGVNDYGVDVLVCSPAGRIVAQCKQWRGVKIGAVHIRALAGSRAFFAADLAILMSVEHPSEDREQCADFAASQRIEFWNSEEIAAAAAQLRTANGI